MKIGIMTAPLASNYGGLLQNYALQQVLARLGHEVYTINRNNMPLIYTARLDKRIRFFVKELIKRLLGRSSSPLYWELLQINQHCRSFVNDYIKTTKMFKTQKELYTIVDEYKFNGYVVGSDQVWRPCYSENIYNYFLDFCQDEINVKRIAYAASFGVSDWEFSQEETKECSRLAKRFDVISVREDSGVNLCQDHFGVDALHVLDPTLLLEKEDYVRLVDENREKKSEGNLFCYILDNNKLVENAISDVEKKTSLKSFKVKSKKGSCLYMGSNINNHVIPAPTKWLRAFMDAKMVFTDSFHGCVFSIIFNKPFWVIGNKERGNARFDSLLKLFGLENRKINIEEIENINLNETIDWRKVNSIKKEWKIRSIEFLKTNL